MSDTTAAPLAHLADDQAVLSVLVELYVSGYVGGAATALFNVPADALLHDPRSVERGRHATVQAADLCQRMMADPAVMLTIEQGVAAVLRGEQPAPDVMGLA